MIDNDALVKFVTQSNAIEGIHRKPTEEEIAASEAFLGLCSLSTSNLCILVKVYQPDALVRSQPGMDVRVGEYVAPQGGPRIVSQLDNLLIDYIFGGIKPFTMHKRYENLHPFTDGNGRSGRMLWLWQMTHEGQPVGLGFLHHWYYQSLETL